MSRPQPEALIDDPLGGTVRCTVLPSGLRVVTDAVPAMRSASVGAWIGVGTRDETPELAGAAHFLEHLLFKGTAKRTAAEISEAIDAVGGDSNAYTARDHTCFYERVLADDLALAVDVLGDSVSSSLIADKDVETERGVILEELAAAADDPGDVVYENFNRAVFGDGPMGRDIGGTADSVRAMTAEQIRRFYRTHYLPSNLVVCAAGGVEHDEVVKLVREAFAPLDAGVAIPSQRQRPEPGLPERRKMLTVERQDTEQAHLVVGCPTMSRHDDRTRALDLLDSVLGSGMSSRLFQSIREERGLAYTVSSSISYFAETGSFSVYVGCGPDNVAQVRELIFAEFARVVEHGITESELLRAKKMYEAGVMFGTEDTGTRMNWMGREQLLYGDLTSIAEDLERTEAVTLEQVRAVAADILSQPMTTAAVGPFDQKDFA
ncbi:M16 family metallopeptidase [Glycomyces buryatensis]|uniref:Insulinase family protein n=1 Tax=Glycomyces buryatensis TaxID=2570927 RepID=A0A4S8QGE3_9ACTN|nr:pitrilysin family protein [Glycomyces buryatensis]THV43528.1 insulinase family protein [Glycomyces buryatensis]